MLLARRGLPSPVRAPAQLSILALAGWLALSTMWSTSRLDSAVAAIALAATTGVGLYLARSFAASTLVCLVAFGMQPGLLASAWAINRGWSEAVGEASIATGIYFNRNSLGPPAVFGTGAIVIAIGWLIWRRPRFGWLAAMALAALAVLDLSLQARGRSATSWMMLVVFLLTFAVWTILSGC